MINAQTTGKIKELVHVLEQGILPKDELNKTYLELLTLVEEGETVYLISRNTTCSAVVPTEAGRCKATSHKNKGRNNL